MTGIATLDDIALEFVTILPLPADRTFIDEYLHELLELRDDTDLPAYERAYEFQQARGFAHRLIAADHYRPHTPHHLLGWYPGGDSEDGFLGWGEDLDKIQSDAATTLAAQGVTARQLGTALKQILDRPDKLPTRAGLERKLRNRKLTQAQFDERITQLDRWDASPLAVEKHVSGGYQFCPFGGCIYRAGPCAHSDLDFTIVNQTTGEGIMGPGMSWHLVEAHSFPQGHHSPHRIDLAQLIKVIGPIG
jgi:hypothetical protein